MVEKMENLTVGTMGMLGVTKDMKMVSVKVDGLVDKWGILMEEK
jgi:hypothetical protein